MQIHMNMMKLLYIMDKLYICVYIVYICNTIMVKDNYGLRIVFPSGMFESSILSHSITMPFENSLIILAGGRRKYS